MEKNMIVSPWKVEGRIDYDKLIKYIEIELIDKSSTKLFQNLINNLRVKNFSS